MTPYSKALRYGLVLTATLAVTSPAVTGNITTKIVVESVSSKNVDHEQPSYLVYPSGEALKPLLDSDSNKVIENALRKMGYHIVANPNEASVFIKIDYSVLEPFEAEVLMKSRGSYDYSNSASTRNYAATMHGGRYANLGDPARMRNTNAVGYTLGPDGKPIDVGNQENREAKYVEGKEEIKTLILHPIVFQATAWRFKEGDKTMTPIEIWKTTSSLENVREEPVEDQLRDLVAAASKQLAKNLKTPKTINRRSKK